MRMKNINFQIITRDIDEFFLPSQIIASVKDMSLIWKWSGVRVEYVQFH